MYLNERSGEHFLDGRRVRQASRGLVTRFQSTVFQTPDTIVLTRACPTGGTEHRETETLSGIHLANEKLSNITPRPQKHGQAAYVTHSTNREAFFC